LKEPPLRRFLNKIERASDRIEETVVLAEKSPGLCGGVGCFLSSVSRRMYMEISIGSDHAGYPLREKVHSWLKEQGHSVVVHGAEHESVACDYPKAAFKVGRDVSEKRAHRGILICGSGIGMSIGANKIPRVYAALCRTPEDAELSRRHNNANVLVLGGRVSSWEETQEILRVWLETPFEEGRHYRRVHLIEEEESRLFYGISSEALPGCHVVDHPLVQHKVGIIRDVNTTVKEFRELVQEIAGLMVYEVTRNLPLGEVEVETPLEKTKVKSIAGKKLAIVPVLRAGLGMVEGILRLVPNAKVGNTTASSRGISGSGTSSSSTPCLPQEVLPQPPLILSRRREPGTSPWSASSLPRKEWLEYGDSTRMSPSLLPPSTAVSTTMATLCPVWEMRGTGSLAQNR
jgi:uracil phosphoribosyltransferase